MSGASKLQPELLFPKSMKPLLVDLFEILFPEDHVKHIILPVINKKIESGLVSFDEFLRWLGTWFLMATIQGPTRSKFWRKKLVMLAPFRLNNIMSRNRFEDTLKCLTITNSKVSTYRDKFHEVR
jgi:Transposase IS4